MTMFTLKKKDFWDIVTDNYINENTITQIASYEWDTAKVTEIIKNDITDDLFKNVKKHWWISEDIKITLYNLHIDKARYCLHRTIFLIITFIYD